MNKSNVRHKRSLGKVSPLSKRPKLDFTINTKEPLKDIKCNSKESPKSSNGLIKETTSSVSKRKNATDKSPTASDWDDDFSGDMLEKVCLIADLSQAMVSNLPAAKELDKEKIDFEVLENSNITAKPKSPCSVSQSSGSGHESLKLELEKLQERLKTKEGEVHILRSQLKQSEDAKQAVALQNIKVIEEIQKKYNEKISLTEKELESAKSKLLFRDIEYKTLSERCRQLEYNISKSKLNDENSTRPFNMSQVVNQKSHLKEVLENNQSVILDPPEANQTNFELPSQLHHEGKSLAKLICPEFFKFTKETSVVTFCDFNNEVNNLRTEVDFDKKEKYIWSNLPKQSIFIKDLYNLVSSLFSYNTFSLIEAQVTLLRIINSSVEILTHLKNVLLFLEELHLCSDYDKADQSLLQNEDEVKIVSIKELIDAEKQNKEECGIEARRSLALIYALMKTSQFAFDTIKNNKEFIELLKNLATVIGTLRRPLRYSGILIGISIILQKVLEDKKLPKESLAIINEIIEEIIFSRPKLDVLMEVVNLLAAGKYHLDFLLALCRKDSSDSCTLYMDCKLKQAMFFTKSTCPLKLLCMEIMGLVCLPTSKLLKWEITNCIIKWLNSTINTPFYKKIKWLPINSTLKQERCFNITECLLYLLTLCLKDYLQVSSQENITSDKTEMDKKKGTWISIIVEGSVLLKRILKADHRHLSDNNYFMRFGMLLKDFLSTKSDFGQKTLLNCMNPLQLEAITWITDLLESDLRNQDSCLKQNTSAIPEIDFFNALKIKDDLKIN